MQQHDPFGPEHHRQQPDPAAVATVICGTDGAAEAAAEAQQHADPAERADWDAGTATEEQQMQRPALSSGPNNLPVFVGRALLPDEGALPTADSHTSHQDR